MAGAVERVRPKMMTVIAIIAGLLPILWSHGAGSELMQRIAVPMIGGMVSSTVLTLIVIPAIYAPGQGLAVATYSRRSRERTAGAKFRLSEEPIEANREEEQAKLFVRIHRGRNRPPCLEPVRHHSWRLYQTPVKAGMDSSKRGSGG